MSLERDPRLRHDDLGCDGLIARFLLEPGELRRTFGTALGPADADDADLERMRPVYAWIFRELRSRGCRWIYAFPRIYLGDFGAHRVGDEDPTEYDPSDAVRREIEEAERAERVDALRGELDRAAEEAIERARHEPLPAVVAAYREVFGELPEGWPHPDM